MEAGLFAAAIDMSRPGSQLSVLPPTLKPQSWLPHTVAWFSKLFSHRQWAYLVSSSLCVCVCACLYVRMRHDFNIAIGFGRKKVEHNVKRCPKKQLEFHTFRFETGLTRRPFLKSLPKPKSLTRNDALSTFCSRWVWEFMYLSLSRSGCSALLAQQLRRGREKGSYHLECFVF